MMHKHFYSEDIVTAIEHFIDFDDEKQYEIGKEMRTFVTDVLFIIPFAVL